MGVQGLWELLAPVGRRVSVETLTGKRLAIDASIWMVQFMKAMRDEKGDMMRNAHLIGFFRRICKLLYLRTKPVFVFDGGTPALKRRTVIARRRQRENAQAKIRKTAEKLLLNHLKKMRLQELAKDLDNQRKQKKSDADGKKHLSDKSVQGGPGHRNRLSDVGSNSRGQENVDEMLESSNPEEKNGRLVQELDSGEDEDLFLGDDTKGKKIFFDENNKVSVTSSGGDRSNLVDKKRVQETLDEMLAASIATEEDGNSTNIPSTSAATLNEEEDSDEDERMLLPEMHGNLDPSVLASLPPSMQLELLVQMRERLMSENRQKYQKVKKAPEKFSELQIQAYLKTVAFRREIDEVQKAATGRGVGGVQASRIASEASREFIFSSSFTGDKQMLKSARAGDGDEQKNTAPNLLVTDSSKSAASVSKSNAATDLDLDEPRNPDDDIEVYMDERGRLRIRNKHMGIRMTRDIQRNLDLMKEKERTTVSKMGALDSVSIKESGIWKDFSGKGNIVEMSGNDGESLNLNDPSEQSMLRNGASLEISFDDGCENKRFDEDDDIFTQLAAGIPVTISSVDNETEKQSTSCGSDCDWEEVPIEKRNGHHNHANSDIKHISQEGCASDESEVEWEETPSAGHRDSVEDKPEKIVLRSHLEEEAAMQEAIRRSLLDLDGKKSKSYEPEAPRRFGDILPEEYNTDGVNLTREQPIEQNQFVDRVEESLLSAPNGSLKRQPKSDVVHNLDDESQWIDRAYERHPCSHLELLEQDTCEKVKSNLDIQNKESISFVETAGGHLLSGESMDACTDDGGPSTPSKKLTSGSSHIGHVVSGEFPDAHTVVGIKSDSVAEPSGLANARQNVNEAESSMISDNKSKVLIPEAQHLAAEMPELPKSLVETLKKISSYDVGKEQIMAAQSSKDKHFSGAGQNLENVTREDNGSVQVGFTDADLEEEMLILDQEYMSLGDEQRRLERNAESVNSEMFAECQELLQIFGLPYIIAPMEAEAQCAYMELSGLVDGVVTDDSDVLLFGATSVYKNLFDDRKYVETYFMKDIEKELGLNREKLIRMALLLGSDYTEGVSGIGIVNAIEVVNAFPEEYGLQKFREWVESPDPSILGKTEAKAGSSVKKRGSMVADESRPSAEDIQETKQIFMDKHRNVSKNWHIPASFPSEAVFSAYTSPQVDQSTEPFSWGKPDHLVLRKLCWEKFGWNGQKTDDLLLPVLKEYEKRETQLRMEAFYTFNERFAKIRSNRIKKALKGITGSRSLEVDDMVEEDTQGIRVTPLESTGNKAEKDLGKPGDSRHQKHRTKTPTSKLSRKRSVPEKLVSSQMRDQGTSFLTSNKQQSSRKSEGNKRGRGRGHRSGKELGQKGLGSEISESSSADDRSDDEFNDAASGQPQAIRRSKRSRNPVNYNLSGSEDGAIGELLSDKKSQDRKSEESDPFEAEGTHEDASVSFDAREEDKAVDPLFKEGLTEDHLQMGGGSCTDDATTGQQTPQENVGPQRGIKSSEDYLIVGGGFCADESETADGLDADDKSSTLRNSDGFSNDAGLMNQADDDIGPRESTSSFERDQKGLREQMIDASDGELNLENTNKVGCSPVSSQLQKNVRSDSGNSSAGGLSAMPFLKRKRRKS